MGGVAVAMLVALTPQYAITPEMPIDLRSDAEQRAELAALRPPAATSMLSLAVADDAAKRARAERVSQRPARMIDESVRQRARDAVLRSINDDEGETTAPA